MIWITLPERKFANGTNGCSGVEMTVKREKNPLFPFSG